MIAIAKHRASAPQSPVWRQHLRHRFAHLWPRCAAVYVPDLRIRLPDDSANRQVAALTFDDGPTDAGTPRLLELLARHDAKATFFLLGENVLKLPARAREIAAAGHTLANHFRRHIDCWKTPPREVIREATEGARIIEDVTGVSPRWCRPPYGRLTHAIVKWSRIHDQQIVLWDLFPPDYLESSTSFELSALLERRIRPRSIICLHDNATSFQKTPAMLERTLPKLTAAHWSFTALDPRS